MLGDDLRKVAEEFRKHTAHEPSIQRVVRECHRAAARGFTEYEEAFDNRHEAQAIAWGLRLHGLWAREWTQYGKCLLIVKWDALDLRDSCNGPIRTIEAAK